MVSSHYPQEGFMKFLRFLDKNFELYICMTLITSMTLLIAVQVFMRYVMSDSLSWSEELARYIFIWLIYLGISYGAIIMRHIRIEAALGLFPARFRPYVVILGDVLFLIFSVYVSYIAYLTVARQMTIGQTSPALGMPMWVIYAAPCVGFALTAIREIQTIVWRLRHVYDKEA
jgi:TRAP-type C4-dicarboxylate transport system permease small subunit